MREEIDAGRELVRRFNDYAPLRAAFWAKPVGDDEYRYLYLAPCQLDDTTVYDAQGEVFRLMREFPSADLDVFRVRVVDGRNKMAQEVVDRLARYSPDIVSGRREGSQSLGDQWVDDLYVYPLPVAAPAEAQ